MYSGECASHGLRRMGCRSRCSSCCTAPTVKIAFSRLSKSYTLAPRVGSACTWMCVCARGWREGKRKRQRVHRRVQRNAIIAFAPLWLCFGSYTTPLAVVFFFFFEPSTLHESNHAHPHPHTPAQTPTYQGEVQASRQETRVRCGRFGFFLHCLVRALLRGRLQQHLGAVLGQRGGGRGGFYEDYAVGPATQRQSAVQEAGFVGGLLFEHRKSGRRWDQGW